MNVELRQLAAAGAKVIQIEEPTIHFTAAFHPEQTELLDFMVEAFNHEVEGLDDVELWIHTCWGNPNMQKVYSGESYANSIEIYLERLKGDVWTVEMTENEFAEIDLFKPYADRLTKKVAVGVVNHRTPAGRHGAGRRRRGSGARWRSSRRTSSSCRATAASAGRGSTARSRSTRRPASPRGATSSSRSSGSRSATSRRPTRRSRPTCCPTGSPSRTCRRRGSSGYPHPHGHRPEEADRRARWTRVVRQEQRRRGRGARGRLPVLRHGPAVSRGDLARAGAPRVGRAIRTPCAVSSTRSSWRPTTGAGWPASWSTAPTTPTMSAGPPSTPRSPPCRPSPSSGPRSSNASARWRRAAGS